MKTATEKLCEDRFFEERLAELRSGWATRDKYVRCNFTWPRRDDGRYFHVVRSK